MMEAAGTRECELSCVLDKHHDRALHSANTEVNINIAHYVVVLLDACLANMHPTTSDVLYIA